MSVLAHKARNPLLRTRMRTKRKDSEHSVNREREISFTLSPRLPSPRFPPLRSSWKPTPMGWESLQRWNQGAKDAVAGRGPATEVEFVCGDFTVLDWSDGKWKAT